MVSMCHLRSSCGSCLGCSAAGTIAKLAYLSAAISNLPMPSDCTEWCHSFLPVSYDKPDLFFKGRDGSGLTLGVSLLPCGKSAGVIWVSLYYVVIEVSCIDCIVNYLSG